MDLGYEALLESDLQLQALKHNNSTTIIGRSGDVIPSLPVCLSKVFLFYLKFETQMN